MSPPSLAVRLSMASSAAAFLSIKSSCSVNERAIWDELPIVVSLNPTIPISASLSGSANTTSRIEAASTLLLSSDETIVGNGLVRKSGNDGRTRFLVVSKTKAILFSRLTSLIKVESSAHAFFLPGLFGSGSSNWRNSMFFRVSIPAFLPRPVIP